MPRTGTRDGSIFLFHPFSHTIAIGDDLVLTPNGIHVNAGAAAG